MWGRRFGRFASAVLIGAALAACASLCTACQAAPVAQAQTARQESGTPQTSPTHGNFTYAPTANYFIGSGTGNTAHSTGLDNTGDLRSAESQRSGLTGGTQTSSPVQTVDPAAVGKAAADLLASVNPTGQAAALATAAIAEAKTGSPTKAKELLAQATAAAEAEKGGAK